MVGTTMIRAICRATGLNYWFSNVFFPPCDRLTNPNVAMAWHFIFALQALMGVIKKVEISYFLCF